MVKATELRIGNWIMHNNKCFQAYAETFADIESTYCDFDPIPLTPSILEKAGFTHEDEWWYIKDYDIELELSEEKGEFKLLINNEYPEGEPLLYLHELQNLSFSLYKQELPITL